MPRAVWRRTTSNATAVGWATSDGTADSTQQNPSFTYTTPGEKVAKLTVSDGEATATRNVQVNVLEPDNDQARRGFEEAQAK